MHHGPFVFEGYTHLVSNICALRFGGFLVLGIKILGADLLLMR
jgi:hypothetical protein